MAEEDLGLLFSPLHFLLIPFVVGSYSTKIIKGTVLGVMHVNKPRLYCKGEWGNMVYITADFMFIKAIEFKLRHVYNFFEEQGYLFLKFTCRYLW